MTFYGLKFLLLNLRRFMTFYDSVETLIDVYTVTLHLAMPMLNRSTNYCLLTIIHTS